MMNRRAKCIGVGQFGKWAIGGAGVLASLALAGGASAQSSDPLLNALIKKGILTEDEAKSIKAEADAAQSNNIPVIPSKWKISDGIKSVELFGDVRFRYEYRSASDPSGGFLAMNRYRYALRFGLRGDLADDFNYGFRLETAANPRSPWVTFGSSTTGVPYQGPFGKSTAGVNVGEIYLGWHPEDWFDITVGKMPQPLYTTSMVWDTDINPEGLAERFHYKVGEANFFGNFGQFIYQDTDPTSLSATGLVPSIPSGQGTRIPVLLAWQAGLVYQIETNMSFKVATTLYNYTSHGQNTAQRVPPLPGNPPAVVGPGFSDTFVGEGSSLNGAITPAPYSGYSGYPNGQFSGFTTDQTGINDLLIVDVPFEFNFKISTLNAKIFSDIAENLNGHERANAAVAAAAAQDGLTIPLHQNQDKAYQFGVAIGQHDGLGLVYGSTLKKGMWEARAYWQHIEQYALDPNLLDSDFFEGRGNLQGVYFATAYGLSDNIIATLRGGYAHRIDQQLGTGGSNQDMPWVNPINRYELMQVDLTYRF
ncbi:MAG TPA: putative porin [Verrucomicrobiae bacterium]|jgi:hypothetical protein|nr:putative porin [Verrucomicrobiae bacterium]